MTPLEEQFEIKRTASKLANDTAREIQNQLIESWFAVIKERHDIELGTIVIYKKKQYKICHIQIPFGLSLDKPWVKGNPLNKDGNYGIAERNLYGDWSKP